MFKKDLEAIDDMRRNAINTLEPHVSGISKLTLYAAQLVWIGGKFPIDVRMPGPIGSTQIWLVRCTGR